MTTLWLIDLYNKYIGDTMKAREIASIAGYTEHYDFNVQYELDTGPYHSEKLSVKSIKLIAR